MARTTDRLEAYTVAYTMRNLTRKYADDVRSGAADSDLNARERKLCALVLATLSNDPAADAPYPIPAETRDAIIARMAERAWNANLYSIVEAVSPSGRESLVIAHERACVAFRNL